MSIKKHNSPTKKDSTSKRQSKIKKKYNLVYSITRNDCRFVSINKSFG